VYVRRSMEESAIVGSQAIPGAALRLGLLGFIVAVYHDRPSI
jgi:hypothetical protein